MISVRRARNLPFLNTLCGQTTVARAMSSILLPPTPSSSSAPRAGCQRHDTAAAHGHGYLQCRPHCTCRLCRPLFAQSPETRRSQPLTETTAASFFDIDCLRRRAIGQPSTSTVASGRRAFASRRTIADTSESTRAETDKNGSLSRVFASASSVRERMRNGTDSGGKYNLSDVLNGSKGQKDGKNGRSWTKIVPTWLASFVKSAIFVIPAMMFWMHFFTSGLYPVTDEELEEEKAGTRRLMQFFAIDEATPEAELDALWNVKVLALRDLSVRLAKSPNMIKVLGGTGVEVNYVLHEPSASKTSDVVPIPNDAEWNPRLVFASSVGVVICYARFLVHQDKWIPVELNFLDSNLDSAGTRQPVWKMEGQLPHGVLYQRLPPKPEF